MGLFNLFSKKIICARCKRKITEAEAQRIGNHRFCKNCAKPLAGAPSKKDQQAAPQKEIQNDRLNQRIEMAKAALIPCFTPEIVEKASCEFHMYCRVEGLRLNCVADFGRSVTIAQAKDEDALFFEVIQELSKNCASKYEMLHRTDNAKNWRYLRTTVVDGQWRYQENASYRYDAIEDTRKVWFEKHIGAMATVFSVQAVAGLISEYTSLLNIQFHDDHWLFDLKRMEFVEISASKERDSAGTEHPQPQEITGIKN